MRTEQMREQFGFERIPITPCQKTEISLFICLTNQIFRFLSKGITIHAQTGVLIENSKDFNRYSKSTHTKAYDSYRVVLILVSYAIEI